MPCTYCNGPLPNVRCPKSSGSQQNVPCIDESEWAAPPRAVLAARPFHYDEGHDDAIASVRDLLCGDGCGEVLWELWPWCLAHNIAVAGGMCAAWWTSRGIAYVDGYNNAVRNRADEPVGKDVAWWMPGCGRPAPGWNKTASPVPDVQAVCPAPGWEGEA